MFSFAPSEAILQKIRQCLPGASPFGNSRQHRGAAGHLPDPIDSFVKIASLPPCLHRWIHSVGCLAAASRACAADGSTTAEYRVESYDEADGRVDVISHYFDFQHHAAIGLSLGVRYAVDSVSGATPVGTYDRNDPTLWDFAEIEDERNSAVFTIEQEFGDYSLGFEYARSSESDYSSNAMSVTATQAMFDKNTILSLGFSYADDDVLATPSTVILDDRRKETYDIAIGLSQVLTKTTVVDFNLTYGHSVGYHSDPYRQISQTETFIVDTPVGPFPVTDTFNFPENRPYERDRGAFRMSVRHYIEPLHGGLAAGYRIFADSDNIVSHTLDLEYNQQLGERLILSPFFRFYNQSAADFYYPSLTGTGIAGHDDNYGAPPHYSSDYRVSAFQSVSYGIGLDLKLNAKLGLNFKFERYEMAGRTEGTPSIFFPTAQVFSAGLKLTF